MNLFLILLFIVSVFVILKFSKITLPSFFPKFFISLLQSPNPNSNTFEIFNLLEKLCLSIVTALLIYFLIDFIPNRSDEKKALIISESSLVTTYLDMSRVIAPLKMIMETEEAKKNIKLFDFIEAKTESSQETSYYYRSDIYINDCLLDNNVTGLFIYPKDFIKISLKIRKQIDNLTNLPSSTNLPVKLIETLSSIRSSEFLKICDDYNRPFMNPKVITIHHYEKEFNEFLKLYHNLDSYKFERHSYVYNRLNEDEISDLIIRKRKVFNEIKSIEPDADYKFILQGIEYRVENGKLLE